MTASLSVGQDFIQYIGEVSWLPAWQSLTWAPCISWCIVATAYATWSFGVYQRHATLILSTAVQMQAL